MIQANELKIGNLVYYNGNHKEVGIVTSLQPKFYPKYCETSKDIFIGLNQRHDIVYSVKDIQPIPLTEELLLKFGFEKDSDFWYTKKYFTDLEYRTEEMSVSYNIHSNRLAIYDSIEETSADVCSYPIYTAKRLMHLHQLQNLYFALTGEELQTTP
jgi:hypothetical protein